MVEKSHLGGFIRQCRQELKYSFRRVEELSKDREPFERISSSHLVALEQGRYYPSFPKIISLSEIFDVPLDRFVDYYRLDIEAGDNVPKGTTADSAEILASELIEKGRHKDALRFYRFSLEELERHPDGSDREERISSIRYKIGLCRHSMGQLRLAEDELKEILRLPGASKRTKALACIYLMEIARDQNNMFVAECWASAGEKLSQDMDDLVVKAALLNANGNLKFDSNHCEEALGFFMRALECWVKTDDRESEGVTRIGIGTCHIRLSQPGLGMKFINDGLHILRTVGSLYGEALALTNLTCAFFRANDFKKARESADQALKIASEESFSDLIFINFFYKWKIAAKKGDDDKARIYSSRLRFLVKNTEYSIPEVREFKQIMEREKP